MNMHPRVNLGGHLRWGCDGDGRGTRARGKGARGEGMPKGPFS